MLEDVDPPDRQARVTLHDVAAAAGVSKSTVSRILDERLPRSEGETAKRVRQVAIELGYFRDVSAASLRRGKTMTIGMIVPRLTDTVMAMMYEALARACARSGQFAVVATTDDEPQADRAAAQTLLQRGVDGLVISTARTGDDFPEQLRPAACPSCSPCARTGAACRPFPTTGSAAISRPAISSISATGGSASSPVRLRLEQPRACRRLSKGAWPRPASRSIRP